MKLLFKSLLVISVLFITVACSNNELSSKFDEEEVIDKAKEVIEVINTQNYEDVIAYIRADLQAEITAEQLKEAWGDRITNAGVFKEIKNTALKTQEDPNTKEDFVTIIIQAVYEKDTLVYTLSFDEELEMIGLYMK
ncbi:MAG: DUF3887 domain-containing protein [Erysipelotrichaceae bacterium]|nr:DUF3887 domain-containing protein [Erysipelotrichaceae bacterium]MDD3924430.1 DUF3887 domain-containing protein [Erysipelotrichaceae bacterium]MDD4642738.1 DUF3887 domain-containing protein [Erysipelotrichaceae bacterium]